MPRMSWTPQRDLARFCVEFWGMERDFGEGRSFTLTPDGYVELMVHTGDLRFGGDGPVRKWPEASIVGLLAAPVEVVGRGRVKVLAARLHGFAAASYFGRPLTGIVPGWSGLNPRKLQAALARGDFSAVPQLWEQALAPRLQAALELWPSAEPARLIAERSGDIRSNEIAEIVGRSRRSVERLVRSTSGLSPKSLARLQRFQALRDSLWRSPETSLAELAEQAGYADQAHAAREFHARSGRSLRAFRRCLRELAAWAAAQDQMAQLFKKSRAAKR